MINEEATFEKFGYYPSDLKPKSGKKVVAICDDCGKIRIIKKSDYRARCLSCAQKGERNTFYGKHHSEETRKKNSDGHRGELHPRWQGGMIMRICKQCGIEFPVFPSFVKLGRGKFCSPKCQHKYLRGKNSPHWKNGASFEPYCSKFNNEFKEKIRDKFDRVCFLCGKTEEENGRRLSVHHVNYNKNCGCDEDKTCQFVPLCIGHNSKVNTNREMWEKKINDMMKNKLSGWVI